MHNSMSRCFCLLWALMAVVLPQAAWAQSEFQNGVFLVAKPDMQDPNFRETVVLVTQTQPGAGPLGIILNRPANGKLSEVYPSVAAMPEAFNALYAGGPLQRQRILYLMRDSMRPTPSIPIIDDVYLGGDRTLLEKIANGEVRVDAFRAYRGFAGWAPRQLQAEIARGGWYVIDADPDAIFSGDVSGMWREMVKRATTLRTKRDRGETNNARL